MKKNINIQKELRLQILKMHRNANSGHIGCSLSCIDILITVLKYVKSAEDSFILSKGHASSALYTILNNLAEISDVEIETFYKDATTLPAHPAPLKFPSIPFATGSLGHGLPIATGIAKANKLKSNIHKSFVLLSDGETNEGTTWEAAHFAVANELDNLFVIVDKNGLQGFGNTSDILGETAEIKKWESIGFDVLEANGHDISTMISSIKELSENKSKSPKMIIANTTKGKGVDFMEGKMEWHYLPMNESQYELAKTSVINNYKL